MRRLIIGALILLQRLKDSLKQETLRASAKQQGVAVSQFVSLTKEGAHHDKGVPKTVFIYIVIA
ncbi:MAG: hypothetical protein ACI9FU_000354 [Granulosicoccus sp.]